MINLEKTEKTKRTLKWQLPLLFAFILAFSIPVHAGKAKFLLAPGSYEPSFNDIESPSQSRAPTLTETENSLGFVVVLDIGKGQNTFALDAYYTSKIYKLRGTGSDENNDVIYTFTFENDRRIAAEGVLLGYRRHTNSGFYVGGGAILITPSVYNDYTDSLGPRKSSMLVNGYSGAATIALTLGYDHSFNNGLVIGTHLMRSLPREFVSKNAFKLESFYMQSLSFGIGYDW